MIALCTTQAHEKYIGGSSIEDAVDESSLIELRREVEAHENRHAFLFTHLPSVFNFSIESLDTTGLQPRCHFCQTR